MWGFVLYSIRCLSRFSDKGKAFFLRVDRTGWPQVAAQEREGVECIQCCRKGKGFCRRNQLVEISAAPDPAKSQVRVEFPCFGREPEGGHTEVDRSLKIVQSVVRVQNADPDDAGGARIGKKSDTLVRK